MGIAFTGLIIFGLTSILGLAYISLSENSKTSLKEWLNNV